MTGIVRENSPWTEKRTALLQKLWAEGPSCSQIAHKLGCGLTRNAVIGKVTRLNLLPRDPSILTRAPYKRGRSGKKNAPFLHISFADLERKHCRYPQGGEGEPITYCGQRRAKKSSYCTLHLKLCTRTRASQ